LPLRFPDRQLRSVGELLRYLEQDERRLSAGTDAAKIVWYRGLSRASYALLPTLHVRRLDVANEVYMMNRFRQDAHQSLEGRHPSSEWEWMFLMRHHGSPSRLLDWSENPLVGLFFSTQTVHENAHEDGALWCLLPARLNRWSLGWPEDDLALPMFTTEAGEFPRGENEVLLNYLPSRMRRPRPTAGPLPPAAAISVRASRRIQAQRGVFTIHHAEPHPLESYGDQSHVWRFTVPAGQKASIQAQLRRIGITRLTLFPELDNVAIEAAEAAALGGG
jgi:hypothetical protein